jgi:ElaB/YqjD/DUF883 family membrane-anchored ribosome-binding protein
MADKATDVAADAADTVRDAAIQAGEQADVAAVEVNKVVRRSLATQPMATLAIAAGIGFVAGA